VSTWWLAAAAAWNVVPLVGLENGDPVRCGYLYSRSDGIELRVEKGLRDGAVVTAVEVAGVGLARLQTHSFDSQRELKPVASTAGRVRLEGNLETRDAGGWLFAELAVGGGVLHVSRPAPSLTAEWEALELPSPLPRGVTAMYLNCAGDLIRPDP
jgi:hypothetical protein